MPQSFRSFGSLTNFLVSGRFLLNSALYEAAMLLFIYNLFISIQTAAASSCATVLDCHEGQRCVYVDELSMYPNYFGPRIHEGVCASDANIGEVCDIDRGISCPTDPPSVCRPLNGSEVTTCQIVNQNGSICNDMIKFPGRFTLEELSFASCGLDNMLSCVDSTTYDLTDPTTVGSVCAESSMEICGDHYGLVYHCSDIATCDDGICVITMEEVFERCDPRTPCMSTNEDAAVCATVDSQGWTSECSSSDQRCYCVMLSYNEGEYCTGPLSLLKASMAFLPYECANTVIATSSSFDMLCDEETNECVTYGTAGHQCMDSENYTTLECSIGLECVQPVRNSGLAITSSGKNFGICSYPLLEGSTCDLNSSVAHCPIGTFCYNSECQKLGTLGLPCYDFYVQTEMSIERACQTEDLKCVITDEHGFSTIYPQVSPEENLFARCLKPVELDYPCSIDLNSFCSNEELEDDESPIYCDAHSTYCSRVGNHGNLCNEDNSCTDYDSFCGYSDEHGTFVAGEYPLGRCQRIVGANEHCDSVILCSPGHYCSSAQVCAAFKPHGIWNHWVVCTLIATGVAVFILTSLSVLKDLHHTRKYSKLCSIFANYFTVICLTKIFKRGTSSGPYDDLVETLKIPHPPIAHEELL